MGATKPSQVVLCPATVFGSAPRFNWYNLDGEGEPEGAAWDVFTIKVVVLEEDDFNCPMYGYCVSRDKQLLSVYEKMFFSKEDAKRDAEMLVYNLYKTLKDQAGRT